MSGYTKGTLTVNPLDRDGEEHLIFAPTLKGGQRQLIASVSVGNNKYAHLFAAAPELLEALKGLFDGGFIEAGTREQSAWASELSFRLDACRAAIAKAEGK